MFDAVVNFLANKYPLFLICIAIGWIVWKVSCFYHNRFKKVEQFTKSTPCNRDGYASNIGDIKDIKESIRKIEDYIIRKDNKALDLLLRKCSPYKITNLGTQLLEKSNGKKCIDDNDKFFIQEIEKLNPLVALDVELYSLTVLNDNIKSERFNHIKNFIYNSSNNITFQDIDGTDVEVPVELSSVLMIMSIYLRDKYFEVHPEIDLTDFYNN